MSCYSCASSFSFFNKEHGCKQCGFSFCSKCLVNKIAVPKRSNEIHHVCSKCYDILSGKVDPTTLGKTRIEPPKALLSMVSDNANKPPQRSHPKTKPGGLGSGGARVKNAPHAFNTTGMSPSDIEIAERLNKLREERLKDEKPAPSQKEIEQRLKDLKAMDKPAPSQQELERRLAVLKGHDPDKYTQQKPFVFKDEKKTEHEQTQNLLDEIMNEVKLDARVDNNGDKELSTDKTLTLDNSDPTSKTKSDGQNLDNKNLDEVQRLMQQTAGEVGAEAAKAMSDLQKDKELWDTLNKLKEDRKKQANNVGDGQNNLQPDKESSEEEDESKVNRVIEEINACKDLPDSDTDSEEEREERRQKLKEQNEFPWCCICNEDATLRCQDCDDDIYCSRCFREGHHEFEMTSHRVAKFKRA